MFASHTHTHNQTRPLLRRTVKWLWPCHTPSRGSGGTGHFKLYFAESGAGCAVRVWRLDSLSDPAVADPVCIGLPDANYDTDARRALWLLKDLADQHEAVYGPRTADATAEAEWLRNVDTTVRAAKSVQHDSWSCALHVLAAAATILIPKIKADIGTTHQQRCLTSLLLICCMCDMGIPVTWLPPTTNAAGNLPLDAAHSAMPATPPTPSDPHPPPSPPRVARPRRVVAPRVPPGVPLQQQRLARARALGYTAAERRPLQADPDGWFDVRGGYWMNDPACARLTGNAVHISEDGMVSHTVQMPVECRLVTERRQTTSTLVWINFGNDRHVWARTCQRKDARWLADMRRQIPVRDVHFVHSAKVQLPQYASVTLERQRDLLKKGVKPRRTKSQRRRPARSSSSSSESSTSSGSRQNKTKRRADSVVCRSPSPVAATARSRSTSRAPTPVAMSAPMALPTPCPACAAWERASAQMQRQLDALHARMEASQMQLDAAQSVKTDACLLATVLATQPPPATPYPPRIQAAIDRSLPP